MPQKKKTARGAHLPALNKQHPKREESAGDANDLEYVDKPDDSSSSGESAGGDALVQSTLPFSGASSERKKGKKNKRLRTADGRSQPTLADFMPRLPPSLSAGATHLSASRRRSRRRSHLLSRRPDGGDGANAA